MTTIFSDPFTRSDNTDPGANWDETGGACDIASNQLVLTGDGNFRYLFTTTAAHAAIADCKVTATRVGGAGWDGGVFARFSGASGGSGYTIDFYGANTVEISRRINGVDTLLASRTAAHANGNTLGLQVSGTGATVTIKAFLNGVQLGADITDSSGSRITAAGQAGMFSWTAGAITFDDFLLEDLGGGGSNVTLTPSTGSIATTGNAPVDTEGRNIIPLVGALLLAAFAPTLTSVGVIQPSPGSMAMASAAPVLTQTFTIRPNVGALLLTGNQAISGSPGFITPNSGSLTLAVTAPDLTLTLPSPAAAPLTLAGVAPLVLVQRLVSPNQVSLTLSGLAPTVRQNSNIEPAVGSLTINGQQALLQGQNLIQPGVGALNLASAAPSVVGIFTIRPNAGALTLTPAAPLITTFLSPTIVPVTGAIAFDGQFPTGFGSSSSPGTSVGGTAITGAGISGAGISGPGISS